MEIVPIRSPGAPPRLALRLPDGRLLDLQAAHVARRGVPSPHFRDATAFRLAASYGVDLARELAASPPASAVVAAG